MTDKFEHELENPDNWDYDHAETRKPVRSPRVVVSVAFRHADFVTVLKYAERLGKKTSEFIREAALEKAANRPPENVSYSVSNTGALWAILSLPTTTRVYPLKVDPLVKEAVVTR